MHAAAFVPHTTSMPPSWAGEALAGLLELEETRHFSEAASGDVLGVAVEGLAAVPPATRSIVLKRLWPAIAQVNHAPTRLKLFTAAWALAVEAAAGMEAVGPTEAQAAACIAGVLADGFICRVMTGKLPPAVASLLQTPAGVPATPTRAAPQAQLSSNSLAAAAAVTASPPAAPAVGASPSAASLTEMMHPSGGSDHGKTGRPGWMPHSSSGKFLSSIGSMMKRKDSSVSAASGASGAAPAAAPTPDLQRQSSTASEGPSASGGSALGDLLSLGAPDTKPDRPSTSHHAPPALPMVIEDEEEGPAPLPVG